MANFGKFFPQSWFMLRFVSFLLQSNVGYRFFSIAYQIFCFIFIQGIVLRSVMLRSTNCPNLNLWYKFHNRSSRIDKLVGGKQLITCFIEKLQVSYSKKDVKESPNVKSHNLLYFKIYINLIFRSNVLNGPFL